MAVALSTANAQVDSLQEYTGKYNFPEGSPVTEIGVIVESGVLTATSVMGNSELKKSDTKYVFELIYPQKRYLISYLGDDLYKV